MENLGNDKLVLYAIPLFLFMQSRRALFPMIDLAHGCIDNIDVNHLLTITYRRSLAGMTGLSPDHGHR